MRINDIEVLLEQLGFLQITEEVSKSDEQTDTEMSVVLATMAGTSQENGQAGLPKNIVPDPGWFDSNWIRFEDWWRGIRLFLKSNRVIKTDDRITALLACLRGGIVGIYAQKKLNELDEELETQD